MIIRLFGSLLILMAVAAHAQPPKPETMPTGKTELEPETLTAIRGVGQSLLGMRHGYVADPALVAARNELAALRMTLDTLVSPNFSTAIHAINLQNQQATTPSLNAVEQEKVSQELRGHLGRLHADRVELEVHERDEGSNEIERSIARSSANKLVELEKELDAAQLANGEDRTQRLIHLRERLTPQSQLPITDPDTETHTPTISTIVEHRR